MSEDRLGEQLRRDLEGPNLATPHPTQARYRLNAPTARHPVGGVLRVGGAVLVGAIMAAALISAETGSANPRVWTVRVASALSQLADPDPQTGTPATKATPAMAPSGGDGSRGGGSRGGLPVVRPDREDHGASQSGGSDDGAQGASPSPGSDDANRTPAPTESPDDHGSGGSGGPTPDPYRDGSPDSMPTPTATPEPDH